MALKRVSPFFEVTQIQSRLHQLFDALAEARQAYASTAGPGEAGASFFPETDVYETQKTMVAVFELPGMAPASVRVRVERGALVVEGEKRRVSPPVETARFHCVEREYGPFRRSVAIVCPVNSLAARAVLQGGLLTVTLPKVEERRGRTVSIPVTFEET